MNFDKIFTEYRNSNTKDIDKVSTLEMLKLMNEEDKQVPIAIEKVLPDLAEAIDVISAKYMDGGRIVYVGAGTSGRLGVLDAAECIPTFGIEEGNVISIIAGGDGAMVHAVEGAEDKPDLCIEDLKNINFTDRDVLIAIAASGRTPYAIGGLTYANEIGAVTVAVTCNPNGDMNKIAKYSVSPLVGPEVVTGSTRLKAGTAQKMILNMISTSVMIKNGKVYSNLMVSLKATNDKLKERAKLITIELTGASEEDVENLLIDNDYDVRLTTFMLIKKLSKSEAELQLSKVGYRLSEALK